MAQVHVYNFKGEKTGDLQLSDDVFSLPSNDILLHQVTVALANNQRVAIAHTKDRSERAGSGRKPWKQKGTGRARSGSVRSPLWRKGGIVFGPTKDRNFSQKVNQKMRRKAVALALSEKLRSGKLLVVDGFDFAEKKTKLFAQGLTALHIEKKSILVPFTVAEKPFELMTRNVPRMYHTLADTLNALDIMNREYLVVTKAGIAELEARLSAEIK
jgi:large subunit ribosomal protein L4